MTKPTPGAQPLAALLLCGGHLQGPPVAMASAQLRDGRTERPHKQGELRPRALWGQLQATAPLSPRQLLSSTDLQTSPKRTREAPRAAALTIQNLHTPGITTDVLAE